jgi:hypothetical protein
LNLPTEFFWIESYLNNDRLWVDDVLNWEETFDLALNDFTLYGFLAMPFFPANYFFLDSHTKLSFLDLLFLLDFNKKNYSRELFDLFIWDLTTILNTKFLPAQFFFYSDYQDFIIIMLYYSPELVIAMNDYINFYWIGKVFDHTPTTVFDLFSDSMNATLVQFTEFLVLFFLFIWLIVFFIHVFNLLKWNNPLEIYSIKLLNYLFNIAKESRVQFESMIQTFFFFVLYWSMLIATFDDDQEELIEMFDNGFFFFFCLLISFLLFKYSIHYFAFLESSIADGKSVNYVTKQFFRDFINTFALFLRFFILLFRLNVYDTLDDFYDSYYIYVGDFDDDEYFFEMFFSFYPLFYFTFDNNDDRDVSLEDENDFLVDLFCLYFYCWSKFFTFIFFILEEILRLSLAFYICYLIIFEVHSVNGTYSEDRYFNETRQNPYFVKIFITDPYFKF